MKRIFVALMLIVLWGTSEGSADFKEGLAAVNRGDYATALREWTQLAELGHTTAQYNLGFMYHSGYGVERDYQIVLKWYTLAANQGYAPAQYVLGLVRVW